MRSPSAFLLNRAPIPSLRPRPFQIRAPLAPRLCSPRAPVLPPGSRPRPACRSGPRSSEAPRRPRAAGVPPDEHAPSSAGTAAGTSRVPPSLGRFDACLPDAGGTQQAWLTAAQPTEHVLGAGYASEACPSPPPVLFGVFVTVSPGAGAEGSNFQVPTFWSPDRPGHQDQRLTTSRDPHGTLCCPIPAPTSVTLPHGALGQVSEPREATTYRCHKVTLHRHAPLRTIRAVLTDSIDSSTLQPQASVSPACHKSGEPVTPQLPAAGRRGQKPRVLLADLAPAPRQPG